MIIKNKNKEPKRASQKTVLVPVTFIVLVLVGIMTWLSSIFFGIEIGSKESKYLIISIVLFGSVGAYLAGFGLPKSKELQVRVLRIFLIVVVFALIRYWVGE